MASFFLSFDIGVASSPHSNPHKNGSSWKRVGDFSLALSGIHCYYMKLYGFHLFENLARFPCAKTPSLRVAVRLPGSCPVPSARGVFGGPCRPRSLCASRKCPQFTHSI